ncbi:GNAT family N-acetyltransferase [Roseibium sediminis]|uniref:GNAT family N-acetyltransferase n=1 Tax=Roseibium sediminis TaxID=1775174 RepID=UPI00123C7D56|nr:GNAT family N-acetyltransferase [Roseibium sediminis]
MTSFQIRIEQSVEAATGYWGALSGDALLSPYQSVGWCLSYTAAARKSKVPECRIAVILQEGTVVGLLPFQLTRRMGIRELSFLGADKGNQNTGVWAKNFYQEMTGETAQRLLADIAQHTGANLISLQNIPDTWHERQHPLLLETATQSPSMIFVGEVTDDFDAFFKATQSKATRKKLQRKKRALEEAGGYRVRLGSTPSETNAILDIFLDQRARRESLTGIPNAFSDEASQEFLKTLASIDQEGLTFQAWALDVADEPRATYLCLRQGDTLFGYANSLAHDEFFPQSPGIVLLMEIIRYACADPAIRFLDLGLGDERYKHGWTEPASLSDCYLAVSAKGKAVAALDRAKTRLKTRVRNSPTLWSGIRKARRLMARGHDQAS